MSRESPGTQCCIDRRQLLGGALAAALPAIARPASAAAATPLVVGGLPVTCNLTLPVACVAKAVANAADKSGAPQFEFEYSKYSGWPEIKESLMFGRIQAAYMLAPLVMDLADKRIPVKIVSLGHRSGAVIMVRSDSSYQHFKELAGKRIAIPARFAVDFLFLRKMLAQEGMTPKDIQIVEMAPPDMPAALYAKAIDAYCTGEPFGAAAQRAGYARVLRMTRDEWRNYICCVLTVREELIKENRPLVQDLVNYILGAGIWLDERQENRDKAVMIAADRKYFNQDPNIIRFVMENPTDRVTYGDLRLIRDEFDELMRLSVAAGTLNQGRARRRHRHLTHGLDVMAHATAPRGFLRAHGRSRLARLSLFILKKFPVPMGRGFARKLMIDAAFRINGDASATSPARSTWSAKWPPIRSLRAQTD